MLFLIDKILEDFMNNLSKMLGAGEVSTAVLNVLAVVGLVIAGAFIIVFLSDLIISVVDHKNGIFFKRKDNGVSNVKTLDMQDDLQEKPVEEDKKVKEEKSQSNVNMELAEEERLALQELNKKQQEENEDLKQRIAVLEAKQAELNQVEESKPQSKELTDEELDKMYNDLLAEINAENENNDDDEFDLEKLLSEDEEVEEPVEEVEEPAEEVEEPEPVVEEEKVDENAERLAELQRQIEELQNQLNSQNQEKQDVEKMLEEEQDAKNALAKQLEEEQDAKNALAKQLEEEQDAKSALEKQLEEKPEVIEVPTIVEVPTAVEGVNLDTMEGLLAQKEALENRLKDASKQLSANKKEYVPLARIKKTLEKDEAKLRRREAIVAKKKIMLFGVTNYVVDPEKERELSEELDQLEALRLSVQHCEEVMDENKDRYPLLENTNKILVQTVAHIKADIEAVDQKIEMMKASSGDDNGTDGADNGND